MSSLARGDRHLELRQQAVCKAGDAGCPGRAFRWGQEGRHWSSGGLGNSQAIHGVVRLVSPFDVQIWGLIEIIEERLETSNICFTGD